MPSKVDWTPLDMDENTFIDAVVDPFWTAALIAVDLMDSQTPETVEDAVPDRGYDASDRREHRRHDVPHGVDVPGDARDDEIPRGRHS